MPFVKRLVEPQLVCRHFIPNDEHLLYEDLVTISNVALSRTLRQLSDLAKHACSIFQELETELTGTSTRVKRLHGRISRLQQTCGELDSKQEAVPVSDLDVESKLTTHFRAPRHQQRNLLHSNTRPECIVELHQRQAELSLWALHRGTSKTRTRDRDQQDQAQRQGPARPGQRDRDRRAGPETGNRERDQREGPERGTRERDQREGTRERGPERGDQRKGTRERGPERGDQREGTRERGPERGDQREAPETRTSTACDDYHEQRRMDSREKRVTISALPPMPLYPHTANDHCNLPTFESTRSSSSPTECCRLSPWSRKASPPDSDSDSPSLGQCSKRPVPNVPTTLDKQTNWTGALPLPTPEERLKTCPQALSSCLVPINVTGVGFDRDASVRCSLVQSQSVLQRRRKLRRRRTVGGVPRQLQRELAFFSSADSDDSPASAERAVIVHAADTDLVTRDSGCQTEDFLVSGAPSWRRVLSSSYSAGNISSLHDSSDMFTAHLRTRSLPREPRLLPRGLLPREPSLLLENGHESDEELSPYEGEDFLSTAADLRLSAEGGSEPQSLSSLKYIPLPDSPERSWMQRAHAALPRGDCGSCEISSSSDTFSSPVHCASAGHHKDEHQSSSGNWSGSSSTCPSQTSETLLPAASPPLTGSSHCDSELSLNPHHTDDALDHYHGLRSHRTGSFSSAAMDILEEAGDSTPVGSDWGFVATEASCPPDFSPEPNPEPGLDCPSYTSMATCESSFSDKPPSEKADTVSHYSVDTEGYYTSMHFDCGLKGSRSFSYSSYAASEYSLSEVSGHLTLGRRCLSLRKKKSKPSPPQRSSSLRKINSEGNLQQHIEPKISCGQERGLQLSLPRSGYMEAPVSLEAPCHLEAPDHLDAPGPLEDPGPLEVWDGSTELPDLGVFSSTDALSFKNEGVVQSEYADLWLLNDLKSNDTYRSLSNSSTATGTTVIDKNQDSSGSQTSQSESRSTTPSLPSGEADYKLTSPEKLAALASPSSGYSSQSETPTSATVPTSFFPGPLSPANRRRKPKVPERKSSLTAQSKNGTCKKDLELPVIPSSELDLAALQSHDTTVVYRTQILNHQKEHKLLSESATGAKEKFYDVHPMAITPSLLHTVQLKSVFKEHNDDQDENPSDRTFNGFMVNQTCALSPLPNLDSSEPRLGSHQEQTWTSSEMDISNSEPLVLSEDLPLELECFTARRLEIVEDEDLDRSSNSSSSSSNSAEKVPSVDEESRLLEPSGEDMKEVEDPESSGVSNESSVSSKDEDYCSKDSQSETSVSPLSDEARPEDDAVFLSPTKSRTTEDLFAVIHRSKRKVLGRKDSSETPTRLRLSAASGNPAPCGPSPCSSAPCSSTSSPTPASALSPPPLLTPPTGLHRAPVPIYRSAKKSSTSNEEFKLLLLKKGSRSESSYRMSATEILKSPIAPKSPCDPLLLDPKPQEDPASPTQLNLEQVSSPYPRSHSEGFSPKSFQSLRQGRPRIPPAASSSRYGARRMYSAPMQAISEGEAENSDGSPHDDRSS